jgi:hypothetical protein
MLAGPTFVPPRAPLGRSTSPIRGMASTLLHKCWSYVSLHQRLGWNGLGSMGPLSWTWSPPTNLGTNSWPNLHMCCVHSQLWEAIKALRSKGGDMQCRAAPHLGHSVPKFPPLTFYTCALADEALLRVKSGIFSVVTLLFCITSVLFILLCLLVSPLG